jgi:hypothetical protein
MPRKTPHIYNIDMNGHTCKMCGKYKTLDMFDKNSRNRKGINHRCKSCCKVAHKMYVYRNRAKINEWHKNYQRRRKLLLSNTPLTKVENYDTI